MGSEYECSDLTEAIIGAAIAVHRELGPGLFESTYEACLAHELGKLGIPFERQAPLPVRYDGVMLDCGYRLDLVVDAKVIIELKAVQSVDPIHEAQLRTYLRLSKLPVGLIINFNTLRLKDGITRRALTKSPPSSSAALRGPLR